MNINLSRISQEELLSFDITNDNELRIIFQKEEDFKYINILESKLINKNIYVTLVFCLENNSNIDFSSFENIKEKVISIEIYNNERLSKIGKISTFCNLRKLVIKDMYDTKMDILELKNINQLEELYILYEQLSPRQQYIISELEQLKKLTIKGLDLKAIKEMTYLEKLVCYNLTDGTEMNNKIPKLKDLVILRASKKINLDFLPHLKYLQRLCLTGFSQINTIPNLEKLKYLKYFWIKDFRSLEYFPKLSKNIEYIYISGTFPKLDLTSLSTMLQPENFPNLKELKVNLGSWKKSYPILKPFEGICKIGIIS